MAEIAVNLVPSFRELTNNAFLELFFYEELLKNPAIDDDTLLKESETGVRKNLLYRVWFVRDRIRKYLSQNAERLKKIICVEWGYCENRPALDRFEPCMAVIEALAHLLSGLFLPFSLAWLLLTGLLDEFCECPERVFDLIRWFWRYGGRLVASLRQTYGPVTPASVREQLPNEQNPDGLMP